MSGGTEAQLEAFCCHLPRLLLRQIIDDLAKAYASNSTLDEH
eukprot:gene15959-11423_t